MSEMSKQEPSKDFYARVLNDTLVLYSKNGEVLEQLPIIPADGRHRNYIISTWVRSYEPVIRKLQVCGMPIRSSDYRTGEAARAEKLWSMARVAVSADDSYSIHAWIAADRAVHHLEHIYVPPQLRRHSIAKALIESSIGTEYSVGKPFSQAPGGHRLVFNPWYSLG